MDRDGHLRRIQKLHHHLTPIFFTKNCLTMHSEGGGGKGCTHKFLHYRIMIQGICMDTEWVIFISMLIQSRCAAYSLFGANCILK